MVCEPRAPASRQRAPTRQQPQPQHLLPQPHTCSMQPQPQATSQPRGHTCALRASGFVLGAWWMAMWMCGYWIVVSGLALNLRLVRCALCVYWRAGVACVAAVWCAHALCFVILLLLLLLALCTLYTASAAIATQYSGRRLLWLSQQRAKLGVPSILSAQTWWVV